eukprot:gene25611-33443_t
MDLDFKFTTDALIKHADVVISAEDLNKLFLSLIYFSKSIRWNSAGPNTLEAANFLVALTAQVQACKDMNTDDVSVALYGCQRLSSVCPEVLQLICALIPKLNSCPDALSAKGVGNALYGLRNLHASNPEVLELVRSLTPKVRACKETMNAESVSMAIQGLKNLRSEYEEVIELLKALLPKIRSFGVGYFNSYLLVMSLNSLQNFRSHHVEKVSTCRDGLNNFEVGMALCGLQNLDSAQPQVLDLVWALIPLIQLDGPITNEQGTHDSDGEGIHGYDNGMSTHDVRLSAPQVGMVMYGLRSLSSQHSEVLQLVGAVVPMVAACEG